MPCAEKTIRSNGIRGARYDPELHRFHRRAAGRGFSFSQETTLSGHLTEKTIKTAKEKEYAVRLFYIGLNTQEESIKRIKNRVEKGGHNIDSDDITRRYNKRFDDLLVILPYCNEVHFYDNENGFVEVGEYKNGEIITKGDYRPIWFKDLIKDINSRIFKL
ncbi:MAG: hypothetical protein LBH95_08225 [Oscillospiraceae bacterium]|jgi:predicted ABC-type ATPase|nr:hypothetical protein [Oscillospiraceae bacterium]